ncbi:MAG: aspartate aminotransferase family protein [Gammaproteobacteria bacterium]|nr:aspartate aminotransferase family protein [Gammaproteobacteria bacterium]MYD79546.1 aspartate aminotransferase family protein [Gammaproteobacteria bacterium]
MSGIMQTYNRYPVSFVRGNGSYLEDDNGKKYLDALAGIAVCGLGHANPAVAKAIEAQASTLLHTSNLYGIPLQEALAERLCEISGMDSVFFCNSGAESNEAALKLARRYGNDRGIENPTVITMEGSFHGRTLGTLAATGNEKIQSGFEPLLEGFVQVPYDDVDAISELPSSNSVVAILVEPVLGEGGVRIPNDDYLVRLREICDKSEWLLMLDEVQTGNGRTGKYFAFQHTSIHPDVVTTAKGLANGVPIGACLARGIAADTLVPGTHATTFGGNPLACAAGIATFDQLTSGVIDQAASTGSRMVSRLKDALKGCNQVKDVRGKGMMVAVELNEPCTELVLSAMERGLLLNVAADSVIRLLPPLNLSLEDADMVVQIVTDLILERA